MLRRLVVISLLLSALCLAGLFSVVRRNEAGPQLDDVAGAIRLLPPPGPLDPSERARLQTDLAAAQLSVDNARGNLAKPILIDPDPGQIREKSSALAARLLLANQDPATLRKDVLELRQLWMDGRQSLVSLAGEAPDPANIPQVPPFALETYGALRGTPEAESYLQSYLALQQEELMRFRAQRKSWEQALTQRLALQTELRRLREEYLTRAYYAGYNAADLNDENFWEALRLEADTFRVRLYFKAVQFRLHWTHELQEGNYLRMLREVGMPVFALALTLVLVPMSGRVPLRGRPGRLVSWVLIYVILWLLAASMASSSLLLEISVLVYLAADLSLFRAWRVAAVLLAGRLVRSLRFQDPVTSRRRIDASISWAAGLWIGFDALKTAVRLLTVGRGLIYWGVVDLSHLVAVLFYLLVAYSWRREIVFQLRPLRLGADWMQRPVAALFLMPLLFPVWLVLVLTLSLVLMLQQTEWGRGLATGALRHWLEVMRGKRVIPAGAPPEYQERFMSYFAPADEVLPLCDETFLPRLTERLEAWLEKGNQDNRLLLVGRSGSGKRSVMDLIERRYADRVRFVRLRLDQRILEESGLLARLSQAFHLSKTPSSMEEAAQLLSSQPRTVFILEGIHQLFLSALGGFTPLRSLIVLTRLMPRHIFWLTSGGYHAQAYLNRALDSDADSTLQIPLWSEEALRKVILEAHRSTGAELEFDADIWTQPADDAGDTGLEQQFFRLLWEQSGGNPATARAIWLRSLEPRQGDVLVTLPPSNNLARVQAAPTAIHLVLAAILRHECLTEADATRATDLPPRTVRLALAQAAEWGVLRLDEHGNYRVSPSWIKDLETLLKRKNMLYVL